MHVTERQYGTTPSTEECDISMAITSTELGIARVMNDDTDDALRNLKERKTYRVNA
jgi:hypothetical protein